MLASGVGDAIPVERVADGIGEALRPPAPAHLAARRRVDRGLDLSWVRRSRIGWAWIDGSDAPLGEERETYRLSIERGDGTTRTHDLATAGFVYSTEQVALDLAAGPHVTISVMQVGTGATSRPAELTVAL